MGDEFLGLCEENDYDPFKAWLIESGTEPGEKMGFISLGLLDLTGRPIFPQELSTEQAMEEMSQG